MDNEKFIANCHHKPENIIRSTLIFDRRNMLIVSGHGAKPVLKLKGRVYYQTYLQSKFDNHCIKYMYNSYTYCPASQAVHENCLT